MFISGTGKSVKYFCTTNKTMAKSTIKETSLHTFQWMGLDCQNNAAFKYLYPIYNQIKTL